MSISSSATDNLIVVAHIPRRINYALPSPDGTSQGNTCSRQVPLCIGAAQIIVALVLIGLGSFLATQFESLVSESYVFVWAPLIFIAAGCSTMAAGWTAESSLVRAALRINVAAAVLSLITFILYFVWIVLNNNTDPFTDKSYTGLLFMSPLLPFLEFILSSFVAQGCCRNSCTLQPSLTIVGQLHGNTSEQAPPPYSP
ncbi:membrane-spanning 4-domains subfamily A member 4D [Nothobranchius furzeri]|uniref:LOC107379235-like protein n=1 Tax=Nothobranchius furzeri TaxID=105023 RepID=A0A9D3C0D9_NOTFU|nr:uncharacterized protein LOC107379235 [Nothobranchius furzeri]XP_054596886.1 uncharacterized protein LOC107379235 [Nothobranchius furzeri]KAF7226690.1 putative LOC107379235-like protein [Nothobranchius furzeri]